MFNPEKVVAIINHVTEKLKAQESYRLGADLLLSELTEIKKHFEVKLDEPFGDFKDTYIFTKKKTDA